MNKQDQQQTTNDDVNPFGDLITSYTRQQAIDDGMLVDVSSTASNAGIKYPVALTRTVFAECVEIPAGVEGQDEAGRLWDILFLLKIAARQADGPEIKFDISVKNSNRPGLSPPICLPAVCGPNDDGSPCITVMMPGED